MSLQRLRQFQVKFDHNTLIVLLKLLTLNSVIGGVHFELNKKVYLNNSVIPLRDIGEGDNALLCKTDRTNCCGTRPNRFGEFYYPNGVAVPIASRQQGFYRNRGEQLIRLNRRSIATSPTGKYRCAIPGVDGEIQSIFITLVE